ncbi:FecR family protein [Echinicola salinicaeni]|uniref:FecR family protein n=1 Tax=Echinicola salinicaeni TaxID=2762757 RepID=UPI0016446B8B|nr:FecR domain-containing protein [Echinicola salinicaeni]
MERSELKKLLSRYSSGRATEAERERLINWYQNASDKDADEFLEHLGGVIDGMDNSELLRLEDRLLTKEIKDDFNSSKTKSINTLPLMKVAAVMVIFLVSTFVFFQYFQEQNNNIQEYRTKVGEIKEIILPDQSKVILNSVSVLRFPEKFVTDSREVALEGEAFFDVERDETRPFTVHTENGIKVSVLGTSFNINDYSNGEQVEVAVSSGKVAVGKGRRLFGKITKGQQITYDKITEEFYQSNVAHVDSWIDGKIVFSQHTLKEVSNILNRIFKKQLVLKEGVDQGLFIKGSFDKNQGIEGIVDILCILHGLEYENRENKIIIKNKSKDQLK